MGTDITAAAEAAETGPVLDAPRPLGLAQVMGYRVAAKPSAVLPAGDLGYVDHGQRRRRVSRGVERHATARRRCSAAASPPTASFDLVAAAGYSGAEDITLSADGGTITFSSVPGANLDGVDLVSSTDPIYVDLRVDGARSGFGIYFTGGESVAQLCSDYNPVAFTSP